MKKQKTTATKANIKIQDKLVSDIPIPNGHYRWFVNIKDWWIYAGIFVLCFLVYGNTLNHQYALDDGVVIHHNEYVSKGVSGIPMLFKTDQMQPFLKQMNSGDAIGGGRYRPLPGITFAIEQSLIGVVPNGGIYDPNCWDENKNGTGDAIEDANKDGMANINDCYKGAFLRHFDNIMIYIGCVFAIFLFFSKFVFYQKKELAIGLAFIFALHPLHSEIVSNIKSRDEALALGFLIMTIYFSFQYYYKPHWKYLVFLVSCFLLSFFAKEYAVSLLILIPLVFYILLPNMQWRRITIPMILLVISTAFYFVLKSSVNLSKSNIKNAVNSFPDISFLDATATKIYVLGLYLVKCIYPYELSADYSFRAISFTSFSDPKVWISGILYGLLVLAFFYFLRKKSLIAFAIAFFGIHIAMVSNFFFDITFVMADRVAFCSSLGMALLIIILLDKFSLKTAKVDGQQALYFAIPALLLGLIYLPKTYSRNQDWYDGNTVFKKDVETVPNSVMALNNAGKAYLEESESIGITPELRKEKLEKASSLLKRSIEVNPGNVLGYINLGASEYKLEHFNYADSLWSYVIKVYPNHPSVHGIKNAMVNRYVKQALDAAQTKDYAKSIRILDEGLVKFPENADLYYNKGGALYSIGDRKGALMYWQKCLALDPNHPDVRKGLKALGL